MRPLFRSEERIIGQILRHNLGVKLKIPRLHVLSEVHSKTKRANSFNSGFLLELGVKPSRRGAKKCITHPILPKSLGLELFLLMAAQSCFPLSIELLSGQGARRSDFKAPVKYLETYLRSAQRKVDGIGLFRSNDFMSNFCYIRLFWLFDELTFLLFSREYSSSFSKKKRIKCDSSKNREMHLSADENQICVDGWISYRGSENPARDPSAIFLPRNCKFS